MTVDHLGSAPPRRRCNADMMSSMRVQECHTFSECQQNKKHREENRFVGEK